MTEIEVLRLRQQNILLQAQSLERDIIVLNYKSLMEQANTLQQEILKKEEEVKQNENTKNPIGPGSGTDPLPTDVTG